jgi:probable rRNA maturation factor
MTFCLRNRLRQPIVLLPAIKSVTQRIVAMVDHPNAEVSLDLVGDFRMRRLNRQYRGCDTTTDVLAFAMQEAGGPSSHLLGDVVISLRTAERQAIRCGTSLDHEVVKLIIHGVLHLSGFDHERSEHDARRMRRKEKEIIRSLEPLPRLIDAKKTA